MSEGVQVLKKYNYDELPKHGEVSNHDLFKKTQELVLINIMCELVDVIRAETLDCKEANKLIHHIAIMVSSRKDIDEMDEKPSSEFKPEAKEG